MGKKIVTVGLIIVGIITLFNGDPSDFIIFLLMIGGIYLIYRGLHRRKRHSTEEVPFMSKEKEQHYLESGMSESEIKLFRETMNTSKQQILQLQNNITKNAKLKAIDLRHDMLKAAKALFKELVKDPTRLPEANHFLYTHLPNVVDLTNHYLEINSHEVKTKETYGKIEESAQIIDQMAALIVKDYQQFVADDLDDLDVEISIAKQNLTKEQSHRQVTE